MEQVIATFKTVFLNAFNKQEYEENLTVGENGSLAYKSAALSYNDFCDTVRYNDFNGILSEVFLFVREVSTTEINEKLYNIIRIINEIDNKDTKTDYLNKLVKVILFTRQPRKGKGEKMIFYNIVMHLWNTNKNIAEKLIDSIPLFGCWNDYNKIFKLTDDNELKEKIINIMTTQLVKDYQNMNDETYKLSLIGKWAPRESSSNHEVFKVLSKRVITQLNLSTNQTNKNYRTIVSSLNKKINTTEPYMCQKYWADINFKNVPSVAMTNLTKAFQDIKTNPYPKVQKVIKRSRTQNQYSKSNKYDGRRHESNDIDYTDRNTCRNNLFKFIVEGNTIKSAVTNLSQIVEKYLMGEKEDLVWEAQWINRINEIREMIKKLEIKPSIFPMIDLSSSMAGSPMINAITLGLFTATILDTDHEQQEGEFANMFMSFSKVPRLAKLPRNTSLHNKMQVIRTWGGQEYWGGSTDIHKAFELLLKIATDNKLEQTKMPQTLAIFSDMQFNQATLWNDTSYKFMEEQFKNAGYKIPHIIFWNLRDTQTGYQVKADTPNTTMLSGYSTRMMDLFLSGQTNEITNEITNDTNQYNKKSTLDMLEKIFEHEMFENCVFFK
jgi:hypothetical protein